jgi:hypothetical protein
MLIEFDRLEPKASPIPRHRRLDTNSLQADATTRRDAGSVDCPGVLFCGGQDVLLRERYKIDLCVVSATPLEILAIAPARLEQNQS